MEKDAQFTISVSQRKHSVFQAGREMSKHRSQASNADSRVCHLTEDEAGEGSYIQLLGET